MSLVKLSTSKCHRAADIVAEQVPEVLFMPDLLASSVIWHPEMPHSWKYITYNRDPVYLLRTYTKWLMVKVEICYQELCRGESKRPVFVHCLPYNPFTLRSWHELMNILGLWLVPETNIAHTSSVRASLDSNRVTFIIKTSVMIEIFAFMIY